MSDSDGAAIRGELDEKHLTETVEGVDNANLSSLSDIHRIKENVGLQEYLESVSRGVQVVNTLSCMCNSIQLST